jgi:hypothetical protein
MPVRPWEKNVDAFLEVYEPILIACTLRYPHEFSFPPTEVSSVLRALRVALLQHNYEIDTRPMRLTCDLLEIEHTREAIDKFVRGS